MKRNLTMLLAVACVVVLIGCKKQQPAETSSAEQQAKGMMDQAADAAKAAQEKVVETVKSFTKDIDVNKSVADLKAEAEKKDVASLMDMAGKYKDAIVAKQGEFDAISKKLAIIPPAS